MTTLSSREIISNSCEKKPIKGNYANTCQIGFNDLEFVFKFGQFHEALDEGTYHTRIITNPTYAKQLLMALYSSINDYEIQHGEIEVNTIK